jgi:hypothetical protein
MELLDNMAVIFLVFEELPYYFLKWLYQLTFPPAVYEGFFFPHPH